MQARVIEGCFLANWFVDTERERMRLSGKGEEERGNPVEDGFQPDWIINIIRAELFYLQMRD